MQIQANGERNITLDFNAPKKFKLLQNGVEVPYIRTGKNSIRVGRGVNGILDIEEILEKPKAIVKPVQLQPQQMALVNPADVISINQAAQQLEIEQNILNENQKRFENTQEFLNIQQQRINETVIAVQGLETDNADRISATEQSIFNLAGKMAKIEEDSINSDIAVASDLEAHKIANNPHNITKETIGLNKVDNTADIDKPVSNAVKMALEEKADKDDIEQIREEIAEYQDKNEKINNALANYTGGIGGNELPIGGLTGQVLAKKSDENGDYEWISSSAVPGNGVLTIQKNGTDIGTFSANTTSNKTVNITVPTQASDINALPSSTKYGSSFSLTIDNSTFVVTAQLKDQDGNNLGTAQTIDLPLESVVVNGTYDSVNKKIILTLQNGNTIDIPVSDLISGLLKSGDNISLLTNDAGYITASSLPTVNDGQLDIQVNGSSVATFTANQSGNTTANIVVGSGLPSQTGNAGKVLGTDGTDASWQYSITDKGMYSAITQYYPGDVVLYYYDNTYRSYLCIQSALNETPYNEASSYWKPFDTPSKIRIQNDWGDKPILPFMMNGSSGSTITGVMLTPGTTSTIAKFPTINTSTGLLKAPNGIDGYYTSAQVDALIPTVNDSTITFTQGGVTKGSFTLNQSSGATIALDAGGGGGIQNTATGTDSLTILGNPTQYEQAINIGVQSYAKGNYATALGGYDPEYGECQADDYGTSIGASSQGGVGSTTVGYASTDAGSGNTLVGRETFIDEYVTNSVAIGREAQVTGEGTNVTNAVQIGAGINQTSDTVQMGDYPTLNLSTGLIPDARISTNIARTADTITTSDLATCHVVIETYHSGANWYRVYSDGWCEQGGQISNLTTTVVTISLQKHFIDTNYSISTTQYVNNATGQFAYIRNAPTTSSFDIKANSGTVDTLYWEAKGYIA